MKNLKKISRIGLKSITGGEFVNCTLPTGESTRCRDKCPQDFCTPVSYMCLLPLDYCGS
ncbi:bacteriocin-like protein [Chryseobacterium lathyri]|uniref:Bacteriocin n=1 Tax=Chryseobacterium lathyri TaxID=395933 RepID=A0ABT9SRZ7_9FLAO|nr:hypothetical protein [Chryseobacterium lathyri]MDP9962223.1 hypothetical protein [Chryseobacterium lathyri]MDQ0066080.1 hypothetical protein [Chryseobacterium lathyri]